jgi:hypothetical protein
MGTPYLGTPNYRRKSSRRLLPGDNTRSAGEKRSAVEDDEHAGADHGQSHEDDGSASHDFSHWLDPAHIDASVLAST